MSDNLKIFQASAGSGKTRTLVKEYLSIALANPYNYKSTLAITFTNKATEEMKSRVVDYLIELSKGGEKQLASELKDSLNQKGKKVSEKDIQNLSAEVLKNILHDYTNFHISTIDSFCIKVLRSFAKELGLPIGFEIELDTDKVLEDITAKLLDRIGTDEELTKYFNDYILYKLDEGLTWNIADDIKEIGNEIFSEEYWRKKLESKGEDVYGDRNKTAELIAEIRKIKFTFENYLESKAGEVKSVIESAGLTHEDFVNKSRGGAYSYILKILGKFEYEPYQSLRTVIGKEADLLKTKHKQSGFINKAVREIVDFYDKNLAGYLTASAVFKTIYNIGIFSDLLKLLDDYRKENRVMVSADINNLLRSLMSDELSPFMYEKIGTRIRNIMIDEFQDTSGFQWNNLKPLVINALSERNTALIVGDVKQSIYRWRNGDMRLLLEGVERDLNAFREMISKETLSKNYRSHKNIIEFNNKFFFSLVSGPANDDASYFNHYLTDSYEKDSLVQKINDKKSHGYVKLKVFEYDKENEIRTNIESEEYTKDILNELKQDGYLPEDILVLVRTGEESISISSLISSVGYDVVSERSLLVKNSPVVRMLIFLLKYITDNRNRIAKTGVLYNYSIIFGKEPDLRKIFEDELNTENNRFAEIIPEEFFREGGTTHIKPVLNDLVVYDLLEHLINIFKLDTKADPYIIKFLDTAYRFSKDSDADVTSFLKYWDENQEKLSIDIPENSGGIRVMTIHKAKGLQSRIVIVPYANWELDVNGNRSSLWASSDKEPFNKASGFFVKAQKDLAESYFAKDYITEKALTRLDNVNLLYVAFTRPSERLYVNVPLKRNASIGNKIIEVISSLPEFKGKFKDNVLEIGEKLKASELAETKKDVSLPVSGQNKFISGLWYKMTVIKPAYKKLLRAGKYNAEINRGVVIHDLLSRLTTGSDIESALNSAHANGIINANEIDEYRIILMNVISDEEVKDWFEDKWTVMNETEILTKEGNILRPDRIIVKDKDAVIIDYKTGKERKEDEKQLERYESLLIQMGYESVRKYILYIGDYGGKNINVKEIR